MAREKKKRKNDTKEERIKINFLISLSESLPCHRQLTPSPGRIHITTQLFRRAAVLFLKRFFYFIRFYFPSLCAPMLFYVFIFVLKESRWDRFAPIKNVLRVQTRNEPPPPLPLSASFPIRREIK